MTTGELRRHVRRLYQEYRAILIFTFNAGKKERAELDATLNATLVASRAELEHTLAELEPELGRLRDEFGVRDGDKLHQYIAIDAKEVPGHGNITFMRIPKVAEHFTNYPPILRMQEEFPPHACVTIDSFGILDDPAPEIFLLEASLFEDMAILWNRMVAIPDEDSSSKLAAGPRPKKVVSALRRAVIRAAFALLEGYLNGLASDIAEVKGDNLTEDEIAKLTEWDRQRGRTAVLSLREKIAQYPKIANGTKYPPLTQENSVEVRTVLELEQRFRHAFIHPTPQWDHRDTTKIDRESIHHQVNTSDVATVCDGVTNVIRKIDATVVLHFGDLAQWLYDRDESGRYPERAFD